MALTPAREPDTVEEGARIAEAFRAHREYRKWERRVDAELDALEKKIKRLLKQHN